MNQSFNLTTFQQQPGPRNLTADMVRATGPNWGAMAVIYAIISVVSFFTNGSVLLAFICRPSLRTSFNVYLMNLIACSFILCIIHNPFEIINRLYRGWWLSWSACTVYSYLLWAFKGVIYSSHTLITVNRIWAVMWPHSYRILHRKRVACLAVLGAWIYVHSILLPGIVLDALYYRLPLLVRPCVLNSVAQWQWGFLAQLLVYDAAVAFIFMAYPVIWWKRRQRQQMVEPVFSMNSRTTGRALQPVTDNEGEDSADGAEVVVAQQVVVKKKIKRQSHGFTVLTVMTAMVTFCWGPGVIYYTIICFTPINSPFYSELKGLMFMLESAIDPVLFSLALPDLRRTFRDAFRLIFSR